MYVTVHFHKVFHSKTTVDSHVFEVEDLSSLANGISTIFPDMKAHFNLINQGRVSESVVLAKKDKTLLTEGDYLRDTIEANIDELWMLPCICGRGKTGKVLAGIALLVIAVYAFPAMAGASGTGLSAFSSVAAGSQGAFAAFVAKSIMGTGINLILSAIMEMLTKKPDKREDTSDAPERRDNNIFGGLQNTVETDRSVPLNYGLVRMGGQFISGRIRTIKHNKNENIKVLDYI